MIVVFFGFPIVLASAGGNPAAINPANTRAASASAEVLNVVEWLVEADS